MAGAAPSNESRLRRSVRLALGATLALLTGQLLAWPLAQIAPPFVAILLVEAEPLPVRQALVVLGSAITALVSGYVISLLLLPYPAVLVLAACLLMYRFFHFALTSGAHLLAIVSMMIGCILVPVTVKLLPELAVIICLGMLTNILVAIFFSWIAFLLLPAPPAPVEGHHHGGLDANQAGALAGTMTTVAAPLLAGFLMFGWTSILILVYAVLVASAASSRASAEMGWDKVVANLVMGGVGMYLFYEAMVAAPNVIVMAATGFTFVFFFGSRIFSHKPSAGLWLSGFFGFLILVGGALLADNVVPSAKAIDRVIQITIASGYVIFAYRVVELSRALITKRTTDSG